MNACRPTRQNWWTAEPALMFAIVLDRDVTAERRMRAEDRVVADVAVVRHVNVGHEHVAIANPGDAAAAGRAAVDGDELPEDIPGADHQLGRLAAELQVLRHEPDRRERKNLGAFADLRPPVDDRRRAHLAAGPDADVWSDDGVRPDGRTRRRPRRTDRRWRSDRCRRHRPPPRGAARTRRRPGRRRTPTPARRRAPRAACPA